MNKENSLALLIK